MIKQEVISKAGNFLARLENDNINNIEQLERELNSTRFELSRASQTPANLFVRIVEPYIIDKDIEEAFSRTQRMQREYRELGSRPEIERRLEEERRSGESEIRRLEADYKSRDKSISEKVEENERAQKRALEKSQEIEKDIQHKIEWEMENNFERWLKEKINYIKKELEEDKKVYDKQTTGLRGFLNDVTPGTGWWVEWVKFWEDVLEIAEEGKKYMGSYRHNIRLGDIRDATNILLRCERKMIDWYISEGVHEWTNRIEVCKGNINLYEGRMREFESKIREMESERDDAVREECNLGRDVNRLETEKKELEEEHGKARDSVRERVGTQESRLGRYDQVVKDFEGAIYRIRELFKVKGAAFPYSSCSPESLAHDEYLMNKLWNNYRKWQIDTFVDIVCMASNGRLRLNPENVISLYPQRMIS